MNKAGVFQNNDKISYLGDISIQKC